MSREIINPAELPALNPTYSQAVKSNGFVFVAGQIGFNPATGMLVGDNIAGQIRQALENTATILKNAGSCLDAVVSVTLYITEFDQLQRMNEVFAEFFPQRGPAKTVCGVTQLYAGAKVEVQVIAAF